MIYETHALTDRVTERNSNIEMLKVFSMLLIVIYHSIGCIGRVPNNHLFVPYRPELYQLADGIQYASSDIQRIILILFRNFGPLGNTIFFSCSAWFLCDSKKNHKRKVMQMLLDVWFVSVLILTVILGCGFPVTWKPIIQSLFPTTFGYNWYVTCYIIFYLIYPALNLIIDHLSQKEHLLTVLIMLGMYFGIVYVLHGRLFSNELIFWVVEFFCIAYFKKYQITFLNNNKHLVVMLIIGIVGMLGMDLATNFLGLHFRVFSDKLEHWHMNNSIFYVVIAISAIGLVNNQKWISNRVNYISSFTLFIYIIHENLLVNSYVKPLIFIYIQQHFSYNHLIFWILFVSTLTFIVSALISIIYKYTFQKLSIKICNKIYPALKIGINRLLDC